jgi:hypothetical protein
MPGLALAQHIALGHQQLLVIKTEAHVWEIVLCAGSGPGGGGGVAVHAGVPGLALTQQITLEHQQLLIIKMEAHFIIVSRRPAGSHTCPAFATKTK